MFADFRELGDIVAEAFQKTPAFRQINGIAEGVVGPTDRFSHRTLQH
jgi:hypothetical protein